MRSVIVLLSVAAAYVLLRGHPEDWPAVVRGCVAVVCLFAGFGIWAVSQRSELPVILSRRRVRLIDSIVLGAVVIGVEIGFLGFFHVAPAPLEATAEKIEEWLRPGAAEKRRLADQRDAEGRGGNWLWNRENERPLPRRTNFKPGNRPEVFVRPGPDGGALLDSRVYLHAFAMARYRDGVWSPGGGDERELEPDGDGWLRIDDAPAGESVGHRVFLGSEPHGQNPLVAVQGVEAVRLSGIRKRAPGHLLLPATDEAGYEYDAVSRPRSLDEVNPAAEAAEAADPYLEVPGDDFGSRIRRFTEVVSGEGPVVERLKRVRNHLRTTLDYSLVTENPKNRDPMENFLFEEQRGHCEFFATAGALMARVVGVPSRVCYGWTGGTYYEGSHLIVFRAREAHAWTEVLLEGEGWVVLDPTPPSAFDHSRPELAAPDESPPGLDEVDFETLATAPERALPWTVGFAALLVLPLLLRWSMRRSRRGAELADGREFDPGYLRSFITACVRRGVRCYPGRTLRAMVDALGESPAFAGELLGYHYGVRYEGRERDRAYEKQLGSRIREWDAQRRE